MIGKVRKRLMKKNTEPCAIKRFHEETGANRRYNGCLQFKEVSSVLGAAAKAATGEWVRNRRLVWLMAVQEHGHGGRCWLLEWALGGRAS